MRESPIRLLVLDGHGVVLTNPFLTFLDDLAIQTGQSLLQVRRLWHDRLRTPFWTGKLAEEELWRHLTGSEDGRHWRGSLEQRYEPGPAAGCLTRWAQMTPIWLLSNHHSAWLRPRLDRFELSGHFERIIVSDEIGVAKPEPSAFDAVLAHVRDPAEALFVDDRARNVDVALRLGIRAVHATETDGWVEKVDEILRCAAPQAIDSD